MSDIFPVRQVKLQITHDGGESRAEWIFGYRKTKRAYAFYSCDSSFCYIDNAIIEAIFLPHKDFMREQFHAWGAGDLLTKRSNWTNLGGINSYLNGIKDEDVAIATCDWFEWLTSKVMESIPCEDLDRDLVLTSDARVVAIEKARDFSAYLYDEAMERFRLIGSKIDKTSEKQ